MEVSDKNEILNICKANHHFIFPWCLEYRCGNCFQLFEENLDGIKYLKCPKCGNVNDIVGSTSKININDYLKIIKTIENEIKTITDNEECK